jgi:putative transposase
VIVAVGVNADGRREVVGMTTGNSEAELFRVEFLRSLTRHGLQLITVMSPGGHGSFAA